MPILRHCRVFTNARSAILRGPWPKRVWERKRRTAVSWLLTTFTPEKGPQTVSSLGDGMEVLWRHQSVARHRMPSSIRLMSFFWQKVFESFSLISHWNSWNVSNFDRWLAERTNSYANKWQTDHDFLYWCPIGLQSSFVISNRCETFCCWSTVADTSLEFGR